MWLTDLQISRLILSHESRFSLELNVLYSVNLIINLVSLSGQWGYFCHFGLWGTFWILSGCFWALRSAENNIRHVFCFSFQINRITKEHSVSVFLVIEEVELQLWLHCRFASKSQHIVVARRSERNRQLETERYAEKKKTLSCMTASKHLIHGVLFPDVSGVYSLEILRHFGLIAYSMFDGAFLSSGAKVASVGWKVRMDCILLSEIFSEL